MNIVDSSGWIEYFTDRRNAALFEAVILEEGNLLVPTICIHEVVRYVTRAANRDEALIASAAMQQATVVPLDANLASLSARLGLKHGLPMADSIIYATALAYGAKLYTQDADLKNLPGVKFIRAR